MGLRNVAITEDFLHLSEALSIYLQDPYISDIDLKKIAQMVQYLSGFTVSLFHEVDDLKDANNALKSKVNDLQSKVEALEEYNQELKIQLLAGQSAYKVKKELSYMFKFSRV